MNALVLGGGGSRGAYQFGAIKALKELGYEYEIITGASVGALNALFLGHNKYDLLEKMWHTINFEMVINHNYKKQNKALETFIASIIKKGLTLEPLELLIKDNMVIEELKQTKYKIGFVLTEPGGKYSPIQVSDVSSEQELIDYIIASCSAAPIVRKKEVNGKKCYDGGYSDCLPVKLAKDMGADKIIAIDIMRGFRQKVDTKDLKYLYIKPSKNLGFFFDFSRKSLDMNIEFGYQDIMRRKEEILAFINS
jgi:NTE family protein